MPSEDLFNEMGQPATKLATSNQLFPTSCHRSEAPQVRQQSRSVKTHYCYNVTITYVISLAYTLQTVVWKKKQNKTQTQKSKVERGVLRSALTLFQNKCTQWPAAGSRALRHQATAVILLLPGVAAGINTNSSSVQQLKLTACVANLVAACAEMHYEHDNISSYIAWQWIQKYQMCRHRGK